MTQTKLKINPGTGGLKPEFVIFLGGDIHDSLNNETLLVLIPTKDPHQKRVLYWVANPDGITH